MCVYIILKCTWQHRKETRCQLAKIQPSYHTRGCSQGLTSLATGSPRACSVGRRLDYLLYDFILSEKLLILRTHFSHLLQFFFLFPGVQRSVGLFWALHVGYQTTHRDENTLLPSCWQQMVFALQALAPRKMPDSYPFLGVLNATSIPTLPSSPDGHHGNQGLWPTRFPSLFHSPASYPSFTSGCWLRDPHGQLCCSQAPDVFVHHSPHRLGSLSATLIISPIQVPGI